MVFLAVVCFLKKGFFRNQTFLKFKILQISLVSCREFGHRDDTNAWRKSRKEADKDKKIFVAI